MKKLLLSAVASVVLLTGCQSTSTQYVEADDKNVVVAGLSARDFEAAADEALEELVANPFFVHPEANKGGRYVLSIYRILNKTTQRIETDQLVKQIREGLINSGKFFVTTAVDFTGAGPEDSSTVKSRQLTDSSVMNQDTVKSGANVVAPDYSLSGKIISKTNRLNSRKQLVEYYFQLTMTNLDTGFSVWEKNYSISKTTSNDSVTW